MNKQQIRSNRKQMASSLQMQLFGQEFNSKSSFSSGFAKKTEGSVAENHLDASLSSPEANLQINNLNGAISKLSKNFHDYYILGNKIGEGTQSIVYKCYKISTKQMMVVKIMGNLEDQSILTIQKQYLTLRNLDHKNIISAKDLFIDIEQRTAYLILQFCEYPNLRKIMSKNNQIQQRSIKKIISKILKAVKYFHQKGVCHRDLKPQNILCCEDFKHIKIIDFDISRSIKNNEPLLMMTDTGSLPYRAPESFSALYGQEVDIWSVGVIAFELFTGRLPFQSQYKNTTIKLIKQQQINYSQFGISNQASALLSKLLEKNPTKRATAKSALSFGFLSKEQENIIKQAISEADTIDDDTHKMEQIY